MCHGEASVCFYSVFMIKYVSDKFYHCGWAGFGKGLYTQTFVSKLQFGCGAKSRPLFWFKYFSSHTSDPLIYLNVYLCLYRIGARIAARWDVLYPRQLASVWLVQTNES